MIEISFALGVTALVCSFLGGFISGLSGFGAGVLFQVLWSLVYVFSHIEGTGDIRVANAILAWLTFALMLGIACYEYCYYKTTNFRKDIIIGFFPGDCLGIIIGNFVLANIHSTIVKQGLGMLFFVLAVERIVHLLRLSLPPSYYEKARKENSPLLFGHTLLGTSSLDINSPYIEAEPEKGCCKWIRTNKKVLGMSSLTSVISGTLTGLFGIGGPPLMLLMSYLNLPKGEVRATSAVINILNSPLRIAAAIYFGFIKTEDWPLYIITTTAALLGGVLGNALHRLVKSSHIQFILVALVLVAAGSLLPIGDGSIIGNTLLGVYGLILVFITMIYCWIRFSSPPQEPFVAMTKSDRSKSAIVNYDPDKEGTTLVTFSDLSDDPDDDPKMKDPNPDDIPRTTTRHDSFFESDISLNGLPRSYSYSLTPPQEIPYLRDVDVEVDR